VRFVFRQTDDSGRDSAEENDGVSRRAVLDGVAGAGAAIGGLGVAPAVGAVEDSDRVHRVTGRQRRAVLSTARSDDAFGRLSRALAGDDARARIEDAQVLLTDDGDARYHTVTVPFEAPDGEQAFVLWSDGDRVPTQARRYVRRGSREWSVTSHWVEDGGVRSRSAAFAVDPDEVDAEVWCGDLNWACVLSIAGAWIGTIASCGACVADPTKLTCLACIGAVLSATGGTLSCDFCND